MSAKASYGFLLPEKKGSTQGVVVESEGLPVGSREARCWMRYLFRGRHLREFLAKGTTAPGPRGLKISNDACRTWMIH